MSTTTPPAPDHVAGYAQLEYPAARAHLIEHGRRLDRIGPLSRRQMNTLHAMLHAGPAEGCADLNVTELPTAGSTEKGTTHACT